MKYNIIYADPPWTFNTYSKKGKEKKSAELHYKCMDINDIYNLPVSKISADNSVLFLWVTNPMLEQGLETIKRWGFVYKTVAFNWVKKNKKSDTYFFGLGYWTRQNSELCLLATKGNPSRENKGISQIIEESDELLTERIMEHSRKPTVVNDKIVQLVGDVPRIELFARRKHLGWDSLGYEIDGLDIFSSISKLI